MTNADQPTIFGPSLIAAVLFAGNDKMRSGNQSAAGRFAVVAMMVEQGEPAS